MTILITGGAGFIGSCLSRYLVDNGHKIRILDNLSPQIHGEVPRGMEWLNHESIEFIRASIADRPRVQAALEGVTTVVHLAAETGTGQSMYEIAHYDYINSNGTALLLDCILNSPRRSVKNIILASSRSVYGEGAYICSSNTCVNKCVYPHSRSEGNLRKHLWEPLCPVCLSPMKMVATKEDDPVRPASIYAATKLSQENLVRTACESQDISYAILRFQNVYGEGQSLNNPYTGILSIFSTRVRRGLELTVFEDGLETRDFVHVQDVVESIFRCIVSSHAINEVINVGSGVATSVFTIAEKLSLALGFAPNIRITGDFRLGDIRHNCANIDRLRDILGYSPQVSLEDGLHRFGKWVLAESLPEDLLEKANAELRARKLMS
ncbi:NAD(P)-dependent oxidoreductase [Polynucleobacter sp. Tro8-14-1]|uniref:NAD-dependent epimerase/dehydratase family protein n=1 Tax=Polynucleobacter sp. Tro8-14-1 TaxID=1758383 RepID=UPI001C0E0EBC|nr:NAD-dependent epimerase/dehydratase family protein [Polynucleobacter sp. Tro8-14-1]MBU3563626.1 NAD-dependent epimerase/dehydratase family protein [Polynucleobacter sp. Tro8-14-1]